MAERPRAIRANFKRGNGDRLIRLLSLELVLLHTMHQCIKHCLALVFYLTEKRRAVMCRKYLFEELPSIILVYNTGALQDMGPRNFGTRQHD